MAGVNKVILLGNMGRDPELTYTQGGMAVCKFSLATSKKKKDGNDVTSWHRCTAFGKTAETIAQYVGKGQQLYVEGELSYGQYEKDGQKVYTTDIFVNEFTFVGGPKPENNQGQQSVNQQQSSGYSTGPQQQYQQRQQQQQPHGNAGYSGRNGQQQYSMTDNPGFPQDQDIPF